ncbi:MAG: adenylate/guanylate cyclase domain-containing protein [Deltaproteobacteria bacterium]|nr:MAG: adenylate/guanylate cyclase domain-containing protein [Deltaproteobacteria bacterium]
MVAGHDRLTRRRNGSMRNTVGLKILGIVALLSLIAGAVAWVNARKSAEVESLLISVKETYVPSYAALARAHIRSLEQSAYLRRLAIVSFQSPIDRAEVARLRSLVEQKAKEADDEIRAARRAIAKAIEDRASFGDEVLLGRLDTRLGFVQRYHASYEKVRSQVEGALSNHDEARFRDILVSLDQARDTLNAESEAVRREMLGLLDQAMRDAITEQSRSVRYGIILLAAALAIGLVVAAAMTMNLVRPLRRLLKGAIAVQGGSLDTELPVTSRDEIGDLTAAFNAMVRELRSKARVRETFGKYLDPRIVEGLIERPELLGSKGERRVMTVCFTDMKGFTSLSEGVTPVALVSVVNQYLTTMSEPIRRSGGIIDKYVGDAIMAFWGPPFTAANEQARLACEATLGQLGLLPSFRQSLPEVLGIKRNVPHVDMRIGIASGDVVVGNIGPDLSMSYTVMGDAVNLASRLENVNKVYGTHILVSAMTQEMAKDAYEFREIDSILVVGKEEPEQVFELLGRQGEVAQSTLDLAARFALGLVAYRRQAWMDALAAFRSCLELAPGDSPARVFLDRIPLLSAQPLPENWDGVWILSEK